MKETQACDAADRVVGSCGAISRPFITPRANTPLATGELVDSDKGPWLAENHMALAGHGGRR